MTVKDLIEILSTYAPETPIGKRSAMDKDCLRSPDFEEIFEDTGRTLIVK